MEPRIQYAKTSDGVSIAYATVGNGRPLVVVPAPAFSHVEHKWEFFGSFWEPLAQAFRVVMYDSRGSGLSDREATDFSMDAMTRDLEAVVEQVELRSFILFALGDGVPTALSYAASHPDVVSHLILCDGWTKHSDYAETPAGKVEASVRDKDWVLYTETYAHVLLPIDDPAFARRLAEFMRACSEPAAFWAAQRALESYDVSALLPSVSASTLVIHNRNNIWVPMQSGQRIAAGVRDARFVSIDDLTWAPVPQLIKEFVGEATKASGLAADAVHTILFTDMEGSTSLTQRLGDAKAQELLRAHNAIVREALKSCGGSEIKHTGDGIMASFPSASRALECAVAIQRTFDERNTSRPAHPEALEGRAEHGAPIKVRIGLNAGEPVAEDQDLFGTAVQLARRICDHADAGEILVSNVVRELAAGKGFLFADTGEVVLKGFEDPVRLHAVRWRSFDSPSDAAPGGSG